MNKRQRVLSHILLIIVMCIVPIALGEAFDKSRNSDKEAIQVLVLSEPVINIGTDTKNATASISQRILNGNTKAFHTDSEVFPLSRQQLLRNKMADYRLSNITAKIEGDWIDKQYPSTYDKDYGNKPSPMSIIDNSNDRDLIKVTKVYRYPTQTRTADQTETYAQYETLIRADSLHIEDEQKYNNFKLKDWFLTGAEGETPDSERPEGENPLDSTYEQLKSSHTIQEEGTADEKLRLTTENKEVYILYEYEPMVSQVNVVALTYTAKGMKAQQSQVAFPISGILDLSSLGNIVVISAEGTTEEIPTLIESWNEVGGGKPIGILESRDSILLTPEIKTVYLNLIDKSLFEDTLVEIADNEIPIGTASNGNNKR